MDAGPGSESPYYPMISAVVLTLNEEQDLPECLASLAWCDDVVVFDSLSTDRTVEIATRLGARVVQRPFDNYASQRNAALNDVEYRHPWVLMVDADERFNSDLADDLKTELNQRGSENPVTLYHLRRKDMFMETWLRRSSGYPTWFGRLAKVGEVDVRRSINEEFHTSGEKGYLAGHFLHYPFSKGIAHWIEKHNRYSTMEADALLHERKVQNSRFADLLKADPAKRRKALKQVFYRMPFRPLVVFLALYVVRLGFLDGRAGLTFCTLRMMYEYMIDIKQHEIMRQGTYAKAPVT